MTIDAGYNVLDAIRAGDDEPVASVHGADVQGNINALHEELLGSPAPGASSMTQTGHNHDDNGQGVGIQRCVCGGFQIVDAPVSHNPTVALTAQSIASTRGAAQYPASASGFKMGFAYVSPGQTSIKIAIQAKNSLGAGYIYVANITDGTPSATQVLTTSPAWYLLTVAVNHPGGGALYRIDLDIFCVRNLSETFYLYAAFPYEF
jgi:hypothetical protein